MDELAPHSRFKFVVAASRSSVRFLRVGARCLALVEQAREVAVCREALHRFLLGQFGACVGRHVADREVQTSGQGVEGLVIIEVKPDSPAAQKNVKAGDVIVEVTQEKVKQPQDVKARLLAVRKAGRRSVLLLLSDAKGELRFVAVPTS